MLEADLVREAKHLAASEALSVLLDRLVEDQVATIMSSPPDQPATREEAFRMIRAVHALRDKISSVAQSDDVTAWNRRLRGKQV